MGTTITKENGGQWVGIVVDFTWGELRQNICKYLSLQNVPEDVFITATERLTPREQLVLMLRFQPEPFTLVHIGHRLAKLRSGSNRLGHWHKGEIGITQERVRQIEAKALRKLKWGIIKAGMK